ncbi:MAG: restriction endonuclease [Candidatus Halichondribacter symbioticus]
MARNFIVEPNSAPDYPGMMLATVLAVKKLGGSGHIYDIEAQIIEDEPISEEEQAYMMPNGGSTKLSFYLGWARTCLSLQYGGDLESFGRGMWKLTDAGFNIHTLADAEASHERYRQNLAIKHRNRRTQREQTSESFNDNNEPPVNNQPLVNDELSNEMIHPDDEDWKITLLTTLKDMNPDAFERLSQGLLRASGFTQVEVRGKAGDGGIDGIGFLRVNLISFKVYFQCKRWKGSVGPNEIRDFRGALEGRASKGLFITTGTFSKSAIEEATRDSALAIDLIDGDELCDLLKEYNLGVQTEMVEQITINTEKFDNI